GRTTLNGEGLQHEDGHSHIQAALIPNCVAYDPTYAYEVAVIVQDGLRRMVAEREDVFFYLTVMNENYEQPALPEGSEDAILRGMHRIAEAGDGDGPTVQLLGSGTILREVLAAAELLREDWGVQSDVWSVTSFTQLRRDGLEADRVSRLHPENERVVPYVEEQLAGKGPVVAATDYVRAFADQIRQWIDAPYEVLGTDGYGRSDYRVALRSFFEVDRFHVTVAALYRLALAGTIEASVVADAIKKYDIDTDGAAPWLR
ncbi:MAG: pyruvate dehydrogenase (acetyl-transferring), homodimeric type, partial [Solirubrobacteraceae bacterium]|nr:pyruvate dehydrogenase (acetyl-transferring), homodimeric type [Solirubrobacteraceae bacterium]